MLRLIPRFRIAVLVACLVAFSACAHAQFSFDKQNQRPPAKAQPQPPSEAQQHFAKAVQYAQQGKMDEAIAEFQVVKKLMPKNAGVLVNLGLCYMQKQDLGHAESAFKQALALDPKNPAALGQMAGLLMRRGKSAEALTYAKKAASANPKDPGAQFTLGVIYLQNKKLDPAAAAFKKTLAINPKDKGAMYNLAYCQINLKQYADARKTFDRFFKLVPDDPQAHMLAAMACEQTKDNVGAIGHLQKVAWTDAPQAHGAVMGLAQLYTIIGKPDISIAVLRKALAKDKTDYEYNLSLGRMLSAKQEYKEAHPYLLAAKQAHSDELVNMALALNSVPLGKLDEAEIQAKTALEFKPKDTQAIDVYAYVLDQEHKYGEAIAELRKWEEYYPKDPVPNLKIAGNLQIQSKPELAMAEYREGHDQEAQ